MRTPEQVRIFVGYDPAEAVAYHTCCESIIRRASLPVVITPVALNTMRGLYSETHTDGSNEFIYSRFLVPWLSSWVGHALWLDGDMVVLDDIAKLWAYRRSDVGVQVVKHDYRTKFPIKYRGSANPDYPGKNRSSVILFNCAYAPHRMLSPDFVAGATGEFLHRFGWLQESAIGDIPAQWNHLVAEVDPNPEAKLLHYTIGLPAFQGYAEYEGEAWYRELKSALHVEGQSTDHLFHMLKAV